MNKVAVITATIGRPALEKAIQSVKDQTEPCTHYVVVDGKKFWGAADAVLYKETEVVKIEMPINIGGNNEYFCYPYLAALPWLVKEEYICFLDDDNWYEPEHIKTCINLINKYNLDWCFALRNLVDNDGKFVDVDDCVSLGYYPRYDGQLLVDTNCMFVKTSIARRYGYAWYEKYIGDQMFTNELIKLKLRCGNTGKHTVNYRISDDSFNTHSNADMAWFVETNKQMRQVYPHLPWYKESVVKFKDK